MRVENGNEQSIEMRNSSDRMMAPHSARDDGWDNSPENTRKFDLSSNLAQVKRDQPKEISARHRKSIFVPIGERTKIELDNLQELGISS